MLNPRPVEAADNVNSASAWRADAFALALVVAVAAVMWVPRRAGPIDLRWDGSVYYILGTSLAEGSGYRLLNEPGEIQAVQYPPLLPVIVAVHQLLLGTSDPTVVGSWLRLTSCLIFILYGVVALRYLRTWLPVRYALLGALLSIFCFQAWFLSDALFPETWFSVATLLFLMSARRHDSRAHSVLAYVWAVVAYGLRTIGLVGLAVWVLDSLFRRRFRQAAVRTVLVLIPVASWQMYVATVERSQQYNQPPYAYQRAPAMFYNVSYARNIALRDPFTPEKGRVRIGRRLVRNALDIPVNFGETLSASRGNFDMWLHRVVGDGPMSTAAIGWGIFGLLSIFGGVLVLGGTLRQLLLGHILEPAYLLLCVVALCLTPFPGQYLRYLMPVAPLLALAAINFLRHAGARLPRQGRNLLPFIVLGSALLIQAMTAASVYRSEYQPVAYVDAAGRPVRYRLFFYGESQREFDQAVDYVQSHAQPGDVIAAGTPHWIHLRTRLKTVMPPFEADAARAQALLDTVPVRYLLIGQDVVSTERYMIPVVRRFEARWERVYSTATGAWSVYRRRQGR